MLDDLFKPAWKSHSVEKRRKAVTELDSASSEHQKILMQLLADDEEAVIRIAAIQQINSVAELHEFASSCNDEVIRSETEKRVNELIGAENALDDRHHRDLLKRFPELQSRIAAYADSSELRGEALQNLSSSQLLEVLGATVFSDTRQLIADGLSQIDDLEAARKIMRGKDKNAERIVKTKIDGIRNHQRQQAEQSERVARLVTEVEYLASHEWLPEFRGRCQIHRQQWDSLDFDVDIDDRQRYLKAREIVDATYERQQAIEQSRQSQETLLAELDTLLQVEAAKDLTAAIEALPDTRSRQQQLASEWQALVEIVPAQESRLQEYNKKLGALHSVTRFVARVAELVPEPAQDGNGLAGKSRQLETALKNLEWPAELDQPGAAGELRQRLQDWRQEKQASLDAEQQKLAQMHKKINSIFRFSRAGNLARAKQLVGKVEKGLAQFGGKDLLALQERFEEASKTLGDMGDWKNFATEPKYIELCDSMEQLATAKHHPDKLSSEMKALQQQWKALGHSDVSDQYWPRFKLAADKVYQPCAEFFEQRHQLRKANLENRQQYVEQMRELLEATDWDDNPDYKTLQSRLRQIGDSFAGIKEVERNAGQKQWKQLSKFKDAVMAKLDVAYDANIALKRELIDQVEALAQADAGIENLGKLKTLQVRWKQIGVTRRNQDQKAWTAFKKHGDIVYNNVQALRQGQRVEADQQLDAYRKIIKDIQQLANTATDLAEADQQFARLQADYDALPELPRQLPEKLLLGIQRDHRKACDQYGNCHTRIIKNRHRQQIDALRQKADLCVQLEALGESPEPDQLQEISRQWDAIELHNAELSRRIEARRSSAQNPMDRDAIGAERRLLCVQLEIAMDIESPAEDRSLRMQYQLEQMNQSGLGQQAVIGKELLEKMEQDWLCMPGAVTALQKTLDQRFRQLIRSA